MAHISFDPPRICDIAKPSRRSDRDVAHHRLLLSSRRGRSCPLYHLSWEGTLFALALFQAFPNSHNICAYEISTPCGRLMFPSHAKLWVCVSGFRSRSRLTCRVYTYTDGHFCRSLKHISHICVDTDVYIYIYTYIVIIMCRCVRACSYLCRCSVPVV